MPYARADRTNAAPATGETQNNMTNSINSIVIV